MASNKRGLDLAIGILLVVIVAAAVLPPAFNDWFEASTNATTENDWPSMLVSLWDLIPLFAILALVLYFYRKVDY